MAISAIGPRPALTNPNREPLPTPSALLTEAVAQGLVRFDASGQVEPALAQSWIVSDDGLRYTFRIARTEWTGNGKVTAEQVAARLRAAISGASDNPLKPLLLVIADVEAMTDNVLEISLRAPRANLLQLLAQPELAIIRSGAGTGPMQIAEERQGGILLIPRPDGGPLDEEEEEAAASRNILLRGEPAAIAIARFRRDGTAFVTGGTAGDLPLVRAAGIPPAPLRFDPVAGLFGLAVSAADGPLSDPAVRRALSMAVDRDALVAALGVPELAPRLSLIPPGIDEYPAPLLPDWAALPLPARRVEAAAAIPRPSLDEPLRVRVAMPTGPGYRLVFAHLRRDWRAIGVEAEIVESGAAADLRLIDAVAPASLASWYLRRFACGSSGSVCDPQADQAMSLARLAPTLADRRAALAQADQLLTASAAFIPLTAPVRWSLVSPRLNGFQPNPFGRRFVLSLIAQRS